jgi:hypothetical protein
VNLYGPETFEESLIDPIKTMKRDILPRFLLKENKEWSGNEPEKKQYKDTSTRIALE